MFKSKIKNVYRKSDHSRFYQGDIIKDLSFAIGDTGKEIELDIIGLKYAVVLSQDCDIKQDFDARKDNKGNDKYLKSLLVCPAFDIEEFAQGTHFDGWKMEPFNNKKIDKLKNNDEYKRYHYLPSDQKYYIPELVLDFKHFFTLPRDYLYKKKKKIYLMSLSEIFREEVSQRFANYLSRIGLPELSCKN